MEEEGIGHAFEELIAIHQMLLGFRDNYLRGLCCFCEYDRVSCTKVRESPKYRRSAQYAAVLKAFSSMLGSVGLSPM